MNMNSVCLFGKEILSYIANTKRHIFKRRMTGDNEKADYTVWIEYITAYDAFTKEAPTRVSERIYVIARERGK